jgi:hypothetical protein
MSNQRAGKTHSAAMNDDRLGQQLGQFAKLIRAAQAALESEGEEDSALRFEILGDFLEKDVINDGKSLMFSTKVIGL